MTRESAWIIPNDYDLETGEWESVCIQWPASEQWRVMLRSLLFTLTRGRDWDAETGTVRDVQAIGREIFDRNIYPPDCGGDCPECPDCPEINEENCRRAGFMCGASAGDEENEMGQVVTDVYIDESTSELVVEFGPCCVKRFALAGMVNSDEPLPDGTFDPLLPPGGSYSACGRASAVVDAIWAVAESMWDERDNPIVLQWVGHVESDAGLGNLSNTWIANGVLAAANADLLYSHDALLGAGAKAQFLCLLERNFEDIGTALTDGEWTAILNCINAIWPAGEGNLHLSARLAIGRGTMSNVAMGGAVNTAAVCPCEGEIPTGETEPDESGWYLSQNFADQFAQQSDTNSGLDLMTAVVTAEHDVYGSFMVIRCTPGDTVKRMGIGSAMTGYTPPAYDVSVWGDTSDHLEDINQAYPLISTLSEAIRISLATQRGYTGNNDGGSGGINTTTIASPEANKNQLVGACLWWETSHGRVFADIEIVEFRLVYNTNGPNG